MLIGLNRQFVATAQTAALEHCTPISGGHALPKAMHAHTSADLGLISSLRHYLLPHSIRKIIAIPEEPGTGSQINWHGIIP
jgi:hypothetical protein